MKRDLRLKSEAQRLREALEDLKRAKIRLWGVLNMAEPIIGTENVNEAKRALREGDDADQR